MLERDNRRKDWHLGRATEDLGAVDGMAPHDFEFRIGELVRFVENFPSTVTGKVQKFAMREAMIDEFARTTKVGT